MEGLRQQEFPMLLALSQMLPLGEELVIFGMLVHTRCEPMEGRNACGEALRSL